MDFTCLLGITTFWLAVSLYGDVVVKVTGPEVLGTVGVACLPWGGGVACLLVAAGLAPLPLTGGLSHLPHAAAGGLVLCLPCACNEQHCLDLCLSLRNHLPPPMSSCVE